jgi:hypothetical protein
MNKEEYYNQFSLAFQRGDEELAKRLVVFYLDLPRGEKVEYFHHFLGGNGIPSPFYTYVYHRIGRYYLQDSGIEPVGVPSRYDVEIFQPAW